MREQRDNSSLHTTNETTDLTSAAAHYANRIKSVERISTGSKKLDEILCGGVETKAVTEFYGESGSGKTQLCHTICAIAAQDRSKGGISAKSIYIDTEGTFRAERIVEIARARRFDPDTILNNLTIEEPIDGLEQERLMEKIIANDGDSTRKFKLLVVDSPIAHYRAEYIGRAMLPQRQQRLYRFMHGLKMIASSYGIAVVVTNQINTIPNSNTSYSHKPVGGNVMAHAVTYAVCLQSRNNGFIHTAKIVASSYHPQGTVYFDIDKNGLTDVGG